MARLIEIQDPEALPPRLTLRVGDVLSVMATGGRLRRGAAVEFLGPFVQSLPVPGGEIISPEGPPNVLLVLARQAGEALVEIISGDPWQGPRVTSTLEITVEV